MAKRGIDRRVARTRATLQHALIALILKKGYEAVTVQDICAEADVGRSTFHGHYTGKDDLKRRGLDEHLRHQLADAPTRPDALGFSLAMFEHARDHLALYRALAGGPAGSAALGGIREILEDLVRAELAAAPANPRRRASSSRASSPAPSWRF